MGVGPSAAAGETGADAARAAGAGALKVSVVIPVRNEEASLPALLESLRRQTLPPAEVVIVDGGSTDETVALARRLAAGDGRVRVVEAGEATPGRGRNVGCAAASHEWIAFTDAGITLEPTWLERLSEVALADPALEVVHGNYEPVARTSFERWAALAYLPPKRLRPGGWMRGPAVPSTLLRREAWERVGGFPDLRAAEDLIFLERLGAHGLKIGWSPRATVWWNLQPTLWRTFRRFTLYSRHNVWAGRQHDWHYGVARFYLFALPFVVLAVAHSVWWLLAPLAGALARVAKSIWLRREGRGLAWLLNPVRFAAVGVILLTIDMATFVGWLQAGLLRRR
jgi:glycosyltransferase involved in cell wall biosynthesis